jgi:hypothetical protein
MNRRKQILRKIEQYLLQSPICELWPCCACHANIVRWQEALDDEDRTFSLEQLQEAEELIFFTCACAAQHCPDAKTKAYCARQLVELTQRRHRIAQEQQRVSAN